MDKDLNAAENEKKFVKHLSPLAVGAIAFAGCVGWGSFVMPATMFLPGAGTGGTALAMLCGVAIMILIAANYHYMINRHPDAGGTYVATKKIFGFDHAFLCAWFLWITYAAILWANATSFVLIAGNFPGKIFQFGFHYVISGYDIYFGEMLVTFLIIFAVGEMLIHAPRLANKINTAAAVFYFVCVVAIFFLAWQTVSGGIEILAPAFASGSPPVEQIFNIVALSPWAFIGFETVSNSAEEFNFSPKKSFSLMAAGIVAAGIFYTILTWLAVLSPPDGFANWQAYIAARGTLDGLENLPTFYVAEKLLGTPGFIFLSLSATAAVLTSLICMYKATSRIVYALAKDNMLPEKFAEISPAHTPRNAIIFVMLISLFIPVVGRTAIGWIVDVTTVGATISYGYISACVYFSARESGLTRYRITGAVGVIFSIIFSLALLVPNLLSVGGLAPESYFIFVVWSVLGLIFFRLIFKRDKLRRLGKSVVVWIAMLSFIFFGSTIWMRQSTGVTVEKSMENIQNFYSSELERFGVKNAEVRYAGELKYLETQAGEIRSSLFRNSLIQIFLVFAGMFAMFSIYSTMRIRERRAEEGSRAKTRFLSNMSHDIRTPMNAIIGYTNLARREGTTPEQMQDFLTKIDTSGKHLLALINDVLEMSRIESGKMELEESENDVTKIVGDMYDVFFNQMHEKGIDFSVDVDGVKNRRVMCDANRLNRILLNIIGNAYKFTPEGGKISVTLTQDAADDEIGNYNLRIKDNGAGMSKEFAAKIFVPFEREKTAGKIQGTGLGMTITKNFVDMMGGDIEVVTEKGKGTEFVLDFRFRILPDLPDAPEVAAGEETSDENIFVGKKILLAEDIEVNREIATMILTQMGFEVTPATDGEDAWKKVEASAPGDFDLVLMDVQMPGMDGYEATKHIREIKNPALAKIPIIAMTANAFAEDVKAAKDAGMNAHIAKPLDIPKMTQTLAEVLRHGEE